jgi:hypothetical protein
MSHIQAETSKSKSFLRSIVKTISIIANISIILLAMLIGFRELSKDRPVEPKGSKNFIGSRILVKNSAEAIGQRRVLMFLSTTCRYCLLDAPFLQEMELKVQLLQSKKVEVVAVFRESAEEATDLLPVNSTN